METVKTAALVLVSLAVGAYASLKLLGPQEQQAIVDAGDVVTGRIEAGLASASAVLDKTKNKVAALVGF